MTAKSRKTKSLRPTAKSPGSRTPGARNPKTVGMIGLGIMGSAIALSLLRAGYRVVGYDLLPARLHQHRRAGGLAASTCADLGERAEIVITSLPSSEALLEVARALSQSPKPKGQSPRARLVIETSTLPIAVKEEARARLAGSGVTLLDCPLSGTGAQARTGDLVVYASGNRAAYRCAVPVLEAFARAHYYVGAFGAGSKTKFVANLLVAIHNVASAEALVLAMKAGLDPAMVLKVVTAGAGSSRVLEVRGPMIVKGDYSRATMKLDVWRKDMTIIADFAREVGCPTPLFAATAPIYQSAIATGRGAEDTAAVTAVLERLAGVNRGTTPR